MVVDEAVLCRLFLPQGALLLQLGTPEGLDAVHAGAKLLVGQLQLLLEVPELPLQVRVLMLQLADVGAAGVPQVRVRALPRRPAAVEFVLEVSVSGRRPLEGSFARLADRHELTVVHGVLSRAVERLVTHGRGVGRRPRGTAGAMVPDGTSAFLHHRTLRHLLPVVRRTHRLVAHTMFRRASALLASHWTATVSDR